MLSMLGSIYGKVIGVRNRLYDRGVFETFDLGARTISIGNITAGGTGKTPLVAYVAALLAARGETVCILTRGYGRKDPKKRVLVSDGDQVLAPAEDSGDEPFELAQKLIGRAIVIADADRVAAAEWAKRKFGVTAFVLDDGFQHRRAGRDVDIVCIDATEPFGGGQMLPAGRLREPLAGLSRADVIIITRADLVGDISNLRSEISDLNGVAAVFAARNEVVRVIPIEEFHAKTRRSQREEKIGKAFAFCGIGNPENFFGLLRLGGYQITATKAFRDHHIYEQQDLAEIEKLARYSGAAVLLTTAKDAVKLSELIFDIPCSVVEIEVTLYDADAFAALL
ncbi:tetraacyldisaccharide 4'-kinase [soil metagenome]